MADIEYYDIPEVSPYPITVAQVDRLRQLMNHEGWEVLMGLAKEDARRSLKVVLSTLENESTYRDQQAATVKAIAWFTTLKERLEKVLEHSDPVPADEMEAILQDDKGEVTPTVIEAFLSEL